MRAAHDLLHDPSVRLVFACLLLSASVANADDRWTPLDDDGWPRGVSLEDMRALRPCHYREQLPGPGEPIPCRPAVIAEQPQWALGLDWTTGIAASRHVGVTGGAQAMGVQLDFGLGRRLQLGARYELMGLGTPATAMDPTTSVGASHRLFGQLRWRMFTDEADRDAFVITAGGGVALQEASLGDRVSPTARVAIAREVGMYLDDENAMTGALELAYEQALDDTELAALLFSVRGGFEVNIAEPRNLGTEDDPETPRHWSDGEFWAGPSLGLALSHGYALGQHLALVGTGSYLFGRTDGAKQHGLDEGAQWAAQVGARALFDWTYALAQVGPAWIAEPEGRRVALAGDAELGVQLGLGCSAALDLGLRLRGEIEDGYDVTTGMLVLRLGFGGGLTPSHVQRCFGDDGVMVTMPTPPPDPPVVVATTDPTTTVTTTTTTTEVTGEVEVEVEPPPPPEPIVIEVELGAVIAGGLVQIDVDPRLLPLDRLTAGLVQVELSGPRSVLLEYERKLRAQLGGVEIESWTNVVTTGSVVRAKFTIGAAAR